MERYFPTGFEKRVDDEEGSNEVGTFVTDLYGNTYVRAKNGSTALTVGRLFAAPNSVGNHIASHTPTAQGTAGDRIVKITVGGTAVTRNQYAKGWLIFRDTGEQGHKYRIASNDAAASSGIVTLVLAEPLVTNIASTQECALVRNRYRDVVVAPNAEVSPVGGLVCVDVPADKYFWGLVSGFGVVLISGTPSKGNAIRRSDTTAGAVEIFDNSGSDTADDVGPIGVMHNITGVSGELLPAVFNIPYGN